jgi:prevent-host-death family protein
MVRSRMLTEPRLAISRFKATCLAVLEDVRRTGRPVTVTRFGKPVARVVPPEPAAKKRRVLGQYKGRIEILGDIVSPVLPPEAWEVLRK